MRLSFSRSLLLFFFFMYSRILLFPYSLIPSSLFPPSLLPSFLRYGRASRRRRSLTKKGARSKAAARAQQGAMGALRVRGDIVAGMKRLLEDHVLGEEEVRGDMLCACCVG
jgi:hypothetical protein